MIDASALEPCARCGRPIGSHEHEPPTPRPWGRRPLWFYNHMGPDARAEAWRHEADIVAAGAGEWALEVGLDERAAGDWIGRARAAVALVIDEEERIHMLGRDRDAERRLLHQVDVEQWLLGDGQ